LVPGTQFSDDFSDPKHPFATRNPWRMRNRNAEEFIIADGVLRVEWPWPGGPLGFGAIPPEPDVVVADSYSSVDILEWKVGGNGFSNCGIAARVNRIPGGPFGGGGGGLDRNRNREGEVEPWISWTSTVEYGPAFQIAQNPPPYRLVLSVVGSDWSFQVISLTTKKVIAELTRQSAEGTEGMPALWIGAGAGTPDKSCSITMDNFFVTGTKP